MTRMRLLPKNKDIAWTPYLWLVYLFNLPVNAFFLGSSRIQWTVTILGMVAFLALYFRAYGVTGRQLFWIIVLMGVLGVVFAPINPGASVYFIFAGSFAGKLGDRPGLAVRFIGGLLLVILLETLLLGLSPYFWVFAVVFTMLVGAVNIHYSQRQRDTDKLLRAQEEIEHLAKIAERERIARDLHDVLGHTLSVIVLKSELASRIADQDPARAIREIKDVENISREALAQVRTTIRGYHARSLRAEAEQASAALEAAGVKVRCDFATAQLPAAQEGVLALALREAVTNVIRHAKATSCELSLHPVPGGCQLEIKDDGCGELAPEGVGLSGMRQRIEALGGKVQRETSSGTRLLITLPEGSR
jgi:two-component system sensor histidine kinase DesK